MSRCDMGCQPDWHNDYCAIYLPDPATATSPAPTPNADETGASA